MTRLVAATLFWALAVTALAEDAMFGLSWGSDQAAARARFDGIAPIEQTPHALVYRLGSVAERLWQEDAFCPTAICSAPEREGDEVVLNFLDGRLAAGFVRFGYGFEMIGQSSETLSDMAMAAFARTELQQLVLEISGRYGPPVLFTEAPMRTGKWQPVGAAMFDTGGGGLVHLLFGHDHGALAGELRYQGPIGGKDGF